MIIIHVYKVRWIMSFDFLSKSGNKVWSLTSFWYEWEITKSKKGEMADLKNI